MLLFFSGEAAGIFTYLIGVLIWSLIGAAAAWKRSLLFDFSFSIGCWHGVALFFTEDIILALVNWFIYWLVVFGSTWRWVENGLDR